MSTTGKRKEGFTAELWNRAAPIYEQIIEHPFLAGLSDGSLPDECFRHYVLQDALYLSEYARVLSLIGVRSGEDETLAMFNEHSSGAIAVERELHESFLSELGISDSEASRAKPAPTTLAYTSYLLRTAALGSYAEALCAALPCYWIYREVGSELSKVSSPVPRYDRWIQTYAGEDFGRLVEAVLDLTDNVGERLSEDERSRAANAFETAARYEWMFWNMGWTLEIWPV
ncbi:MAG: thiaminase II [Rubrobacter sp.]|nr:thiaminase II [Rubrobacter sp.]